MNLALQGHGAPPDWTVTLAMAEAWGVTPWDVEAAASALWADRFVAFRNAQANAAKPKRKPGGNRREML